MEQLQHEIGADWYLLHDADQFRLAPNPFRTLAEGITAMDQAGYTAINFDIFDFTLTGPDENYEGGKFLSEMKYYYHYRPVADHQVKCWKYFGQKIDLVGSGGHKIAFEGKLLAPQHFIQKHYIAISRQHLIQKYCERRFSPEELRDGWHGARALIKPEDFRYPSRESLKVVNDRNVWDTSDPWTKRFIFTGVDLEQRRDEMQALIDAEVGPIEGDKRCL